MLARTWRARTALVSVALLVACLKGNAPTGLGPNEARFALSAQVSGGSTLHITVDYLDQPSVQVPLVDQTITVAAGTANVPLTIDLTRCLADAQHVASAASTCELVANVVLMQNGTVVDSVTVGPVTATPGQVVRATTSVTAIGRVVVFPDTASLTVGAITILRDSVFAASGAYLANATVAWSSADTTIATVNDSGAVTGRGAGSTQVTARAGSLQGSAVVNVSSAGTGGLVANISAIQFSAPAGGTIPPNAVLSITSSDSTVVSGLTATITYGSSTTGWLLANVSDSAFGSRVAKAPGLQAVRVQHMIARQTEGGSSITTPAALDIVPNTSSLAAGQYTATVTVTGSNGRSVSVSVTYTITSGATIAITPTTGVTDTAIGGGAAVTKKVVVTNGGTGTLSGLSESITYNGTATGWLSVSQGATTAPDTLSITASPATLSAGTYTASVIVSSSVTGVNTNGFTVTLIVNAGGALLTFPVDTVTFLEYNYGTTLASSRQFNYVNTGTGTLGTAALDSAHWNGADTGYLSVGITSSTITIQPKTTAINFIGNLTDTLWFSAPGASNNPQPIAVYMQTSITYAKVVAGAQFGCGLTTEGSVYCWGDNTYGEFGDNSTTSPDGSLGPARVLLPITSTDTVVDIVAGARHACALMSNNQVYCWGDNTEGQLGQGTTSSTPVRTPVVIPGGRTYSAIAAGAYHTCGIEGTGGANTLDCWGSNSNGQLGTNSGSPNALPTPVAITLATVSAGGNNTCGLTNVGDGSIYCWGDNTDGQVGAGTTGGNDTLPKVVTLTGGAIPAMVSAGTNVSCAIDVNANAYCWGDNTYGELGTNGGPSTSIPIQVSSGQYASISAGVEFACGIATTKIVAYCWGLNGNGQLGIGSSASYATAPTAIALPFGGTVSSLIASPQGPEMCFLESPNAFCAGNNAAGQLGYFLSFLSINSSPLGLIDQPASQGTASRVVPRPRVTRRTH